MRINQQKMSGVKQTTTPYAHFVSIVADTLKQKSYKNTPDLSIIVEGETIFQLSQLFMLMCQTCSTIKQEFIVL